MPNTFPSGRPRRSALYVPASNARALDKARRLPCDVVILDLEDAVAPEAKEAARAAAVSAIADGGFGTRELMVRINGLDTPWGAADLQAIVAAAPDALLVPKITDRDSLRPYDEALRVTGAGAVALWAMIETARSVLCLDAIAASAAQGRLAGLIAGTNDLCKETGMQTDLERRPLHGALASMVFAARAHGLAALDGVCNALDDAPGFARQCAQAREFGFDGKTLIHPAQIDACQTAFTPDEQAVAAARAIVAAFEAHENAGKGAIRLDGRMVERLHLHEALRTLARAGVLKPSGAA
jgi:citrate lyase subunit beta / citryl-CoA lyase